MGVHRLLGRMPSLVEWSADGDRQPHSWDAFLPARDQAGEWELIRLSTIHDESNSGWIVLTPT